MQPKFVKIGRNVIWQEVLWPASCVFGIMVMKIDFSTPPFDGAGQKPNHDPQKPHSSFPSTLPPNHALSQRPPMGQKNRAAAHPFALWRHLYSHPAAKPKAGIFPKTNFRRNRPRSNPGTGIYLLPGEKKRYSF